MAGLEDIIFQIWWPFFFRFSVEARLEGSEVSDKGFFFKSRPFHQIPEEVSPVDSECAETQ